MRRTWTRKCECGCNTTIVINSQHPHTKYIKGHQKAWLGKKRPEVKSWLNCFEKGHKPWNKGKKQLQSTNEKHHSWKGENVGYYALHAWLNRHKNKPEVCDFCGDKKLLDWANKDGEYKRNLKDWFALCRNCHRNYDVNNGLGKVKRRFNHG